MWMSYGRRAESRPAPEAERLRAALDLAARLAAPLAIAVLFLYPNPLVPVALGVLVLLAARGLARRARDGGATPLDAAFGLFLAGTLLGFVVAHNREAAQLRLTGIVGAVGVFYALLSVLGSERSLRRGALGLLAAILGGMLAVLALLRGSLPDSPVSRALRPLLAPFAAFAGVGGDALDVNTRFAVHQYGLAHLLLVAGAFAVAAVVLGRGRTRRLGLAGLALAGSLMLATQSRGGILALAVAATVVATFRTRLAWALLPIAGGVFYALLARGVISRPVEAEWLSDRLAYWTGTLFMLGDFPFTGVGLGVRTFAEAFAWYGRLPSPYVVPHTHNIFLQAYAEQGLLGMVGLLGVVAGAVALGLRATRRTVGPERWLVAGAFGGIVGSALYGLTDQVPTTNLSLALVCALAALVVAADRLATAATPASRAEVAPRRAPDPASVPPHPIDGQRAGAGARPTWLPSLPASALLSPSRLGAALFAAVLVVGGVSIAPRWISGLYLNAGSSELLAATLDRPRDAELRAARLARATALLEQSWAWNDRSVAAIRGLGRARLLRHDLAGARQAIEAAYRPDATPFERAQLARLAREAGQIELTITLLRESGAEDDLKSVADELMAARRWREAAAAYAALAEVDPDEAEYASNAAKAVLEGGGDAEQAMALLREAVARNPGAARNLARQLTLRGEPFRNDEKRGGGNFPAARFWFTLASRVDPAYDRPEVELGSLHFYRERYDEAAEHFGEALRRDPRNASTYHQLAETYLKLGRTEEAVAFYERGVGLRPERAELHANLARAYLLAERRDDALASLRTAATLAPGNAAIRAELDRLEAGG
jgi:tetratricopeptide (TPR) repeat protein/O-antigen ligase